MPDYNSYKMHMHSTGLNRKNLAAQRWNVILLMCNFIGAVVYVIAASPSWAIPQERAAGIYTLTGEPYVWAVAVFPIWALFLALNLMWGLFIVIRKRWRAGILWLVTIPIWLLGAAVDFAHH